MIVKVTEENIIDAAGIHAESWKESHKDFCSKEFVEQHTVARQTNYLFQEMKQGKEVYMLIEKEPVGIVSIQKNLIENLYVLPKEWGRGYGTRLLQFAIEKCEGTPELWILNNNKRAYQLYVKQGFFRTGAVKQLSETLSEVEMKKYEIIHLPKEQWKGHPLPITYTTESYYDVAIAEKADGFSVDITKKKLEQPVTHSPEKSGVMDRLYEDWWEKACAWGVVEDGALIAAIQTAPEEWSNRLRVVDIWIAPEYQKQGLGHALMEIAKEQAFLERRRAIILETQSCNVNAIGFYLHEGFTFIGLDKCCYSNRDIEQKEVRLELGYFSEKNKRPTREQVEIRKETPEDYHAVERAAQEAFWNRHEKGCNEHYLIHLLRDSKEYLPELSRIAVIDGEVVGTIMYSKAWVKDGEKVHEVVTFGPLCVKPKWHGCGIGEMLLQETMPLAKEAGYPGIVIFGEPEYYPRIGFKTCDNFGITTPDGKNFDAFMGIALIPEKMGEIHGKFYEAEAFEQSGDGGAEEYNQNFAPMKKQYFPSQW